MGRIVSSTPTYKKSPHTRIPTGHGTTRIRRTVGVHVVVGKRVSPPIELHGVHGLTIPVRRTGRVIVTGGQTGLNVAPGQQQRRALQRRTHPRHDGEGHVVVAVLLPEHALAPEYVQRAGLRDRARRSLAHQRPGRRGAGDVPHRGVLRVDRQRLAGVQRPHALHVRGVVVAERVAVDRDVLARRVGAERRSSGLGVLAQLVPGLTVLRGVGGEVVADGRHGALRHAADRLGAAAVGGGELHPDGHADEVDERHVRVQSAGLSVCHFGKAPEDACRWVAWVLRVRADQRDAPGGSLQCVELEVAGGEVYTAGDEKVRECQAGGLALAAERDGDVLGDGLWDGRRAGCRVVPLA